MPTYSRIDENNIVAEVNSGSEEWVQDQTGRWIETEPHVQGNINLINGVTLRKNFGRIGYVYHEDIDVFAPPIAFTGWILNPDTAQWEPPTPNPGNDGDLYFWDNETVSWVQAGPGQAARS